MTLRFAVYRQDHPEPSVTHPTPIRWLTRWRSTSENLDTSDRNSPRFSDELADLAFAALDHAIDSVRDGGPLIPFVMADGAEGRTLQRFAAVTLEQGLGEAVVSVRARRDEPGTRHALAYDGYLTVDGSRSDAIYVEAVEPGNDEVMVLAQRYRPKKALRKFETVGRPALVPEESAKLTG